MHSCCTVLIGKNKNTLITTFFKTTLVFFFFSNRWSIKEQRPFSVLQFSLADVSELLLYCICSCFIISTNGVTFPSPFYSLDCY